MGFDENFYEQEVLDRALLDEAILADLLVRYGFTEPPASHEEFDAQVRRVVRKWKSLENTSTWTVLIPFLLIAHSRMDAAGMLSADAFLAHREETRADVARRLSERIRLENATHVGSATVTWLSVSTGADLAQVQVALSTAEIKVADPLPALPSAEPPGYAVLRAGTRDLDRRLSAEVIFGPGAVRAGFTAIDGFRLDSGDQLDEALREAESLTDQMTTRNPEKIPTANVLTVVRSALDARQTDQLLWWEVIQPLREQAAMGVGQRALADYAASGGLNSDEAGRVAAAVIEERLPAADQAVSAPPAPGPVTAQVLADRVLLNWDSAVTQGNAVIYRVTRQIGRLPVSAADGTVIVAETREPRRSDLHPPPGEDLRYAVFAGTEARGTRGQREPRWSAPAGTGEVLFVPEVTDLDVRPAGSGSVTASWMVPAGATRVRVVRVTDAGDVEVESGLAGCTDSGLTPGAAYRYFIQAVYEVSDGRTRSSAGTSVEVCTVPAAVTALSVQQSAGLIQVSWAPPLSGLVQLFLTEIPPLWPPGTEVDTAELARLGEPLPGVQRRSGSQALMEHPAPPGRNFLTAVTRTGDLAVIGASVQFGQLEPVRELRAHRLIARPGQPDQVRLSWIWPAGAASSLISWADGERSCSWGEYHAEGGVRIAAGSHEITFQVSAIHRDADSAQTAAPARVSVPAGKIKISYRFRRALSPWSSPWVLELVADQSCQLPELVVVRSSAAFPPDEPANCTEIAKLTPKECRRGRPVRYRVALPRDAAGFPACFFAAECDDLLLFPPRPTRVRVW